MQDDLEKTHQPTPQKINKYRQKGQVALSKDVFNLTAVLALIICYYLLDLQILKNFFIAILQNYCKTQNLWGLMGHDNFFYFIIGNLLQPLFLIFCLFLLTQLLQSKFLFKIPQNNKLNVAKNIGNIFKNFGSTIIKDIIKFFLFFLLILFLYYNCNKDLTKTLKITLLILLGCVCLIGLLDIIYQNYKFNKDLKMSLQEIKDELKETEGNPEIKQKQRSLIFSKKTQKMLDMVKDSTVVITNPTHYAVALQYAYHESSVPRVVAKGNDIIAQKIKQLAFEHGIPMVSNQALARQIYREIKLNQPITQKFFEAVVLIIKSLYTLENNKLKRL